MAVRTALARQVGGFPPYYYGEDVAFSHSVSERGTRLLYVPRLRVLHNERRSMGAVFGATFRKGRARVRLARTQGIHELIHMAPALLCLYLVIAALAVTIWPDRALPGLAPAAAHCLMLGILAAQGGVSIGSLTAALCIPFYTVAMHLGYGIGYWTGWAAVVAQAIRRRGAPRLPVGADRERAMPAPAAPGSTSSMACAQYCATSSPPCAADATAIAIDICRSEAGE